VSRCLLALAVLLWAAPVAAQPARDEVIAAARARFEQALSLYQEGSFAEAARVFEQAYSLSPQPELLHNIYLAYRDLGDLPRAADALRRYLEVEDDLTDEERRILTHRLAALDAAVAEAEAEPTPEPTPEPPPLAEPLPDPVVETPVVTPPPPERDPPWGAVVGYSLAAAGLVTTAVTGGLALSERSELESRCAPTCSDDDVSSMSALGVAADVGLGVAGAGAVVGTVLLVLWLVEGDPSPDVAVDASPVRGGAVVTVRGAL